MDNLFPKGRNPAFWVHRRAPAERPQSAPGGFEGKGVPPIPPAQHRSLRLNSPGFTNPSAPPLGPIAHALVHGVRQMRVGGESPETQEYPRPPI